MIDFSNLAQTNPEDELLYTSLRAHSWDEFYGQQNVKTTVRIMIDAAKERTETIDHILFYGPPGLGKTTLAHLIAQEMDSHLVITSGTALAKVSDLAAIITNLQANDVLFIDEVHRLPKAIEEALYPAMEEFALDIVIGKGPSARTIRLDLPHFTIIGATTRFGALASPFRDRFGMIQQLQYYEPTELETILLRAAQKLHLSLNTESAQAIARRARGTPRIALKLLKRVRDFAQVKAAGEVSPKVVADALSLFAIDELGLDETDRRFLKLILEQHRGGPVGLSTLAASFREDAGTIEEVLEPYLLQIGFLQRTPKGRVVTEAATRHLQKS